MKATILVRHLNPMRDHLSYSVADSEERRQEFHSNPQAMLDHSKETEHQLNTLFFGMAKNGSKEQAETIKALYGHMVKTIKDESMLQSR